MAMLSARVPIILGAITIISVIIAKYMQSPEIFILTVFITSYLYHKYTTPKDAAKLDFDSKVVNIAKFIIIVGVIGVALVKILELFSVSWAS